MTQNVFYSVAKLTSEVKLQCNHTNWSMCKILISHVHHMLQVGGTIGSPLFLRSGNQGDKWTVGQATIPRIVATQSYQVCIMSIRFLNIQPSLCLVVTSIKQPVAFMGQCSVIPYNQFDSKLTCISSHLPLKVIFILSSDCLFKIGFTVHG